MRKFLLLIGFTILCSITYSQNKSTGTKPFILGQIDEIQSNILGEKRTLNIYLPPEYKDNDTVKYPVVYLLDGGADEDFIHVVGLYQFNSFPWINLVRPSIIVGITNTHRQRDMTYATSDTTFRRKYPTAGHSDKFMEFLDKELQPYVQKKFQTNSSRTLIGESLGGLLAVEILLKRPTLFNTYIIVSPSFWWDSGSLLEQPSPVFDSSFQNKTNVYVGVGKEGLMPGRVPRVMEVDANILADKLKSSKSKSLTVYFDYLPQEDHATIMHQAVFNALRLLNKKKVD